jgi:peptidoglycan/LPS O-acetylase OafA/YrhL
MDALPWHLLYLQNIQHYWGGRLPGMDNALAHTWTLAIEEQFYLIWPAVLILVGRKRLRPLALFLAILPAGLRAIGLSSEVLFGHCDGLAMGALLASLEGDAAETATASRKRAYLIACLTAFAGYWALWFYLSTRGYAGEKMVTCNGAIILITLCYFGLIGFVACTAGQNCLRWLRLPALVYLGQISYGLYLYHWVLYSYIDTKLKFGLGFRDPWWLDALKVVVSLGVAAASWRFVEQPILSLKDRFSYRSEQQARDRAGHSVSSLEPALAGVESEA